MHCFRIYDIYKVTAFFVVVAMNIDISKLFLPEGKLHFKMPEREGPHTPLNNSRFSRLDALHLYYAKKFGPHILNISGFLCLPRKKLTGFTLPPVEVIYIYVNIFQIWAPKM